MRICLYTETALPMLGGQELVVDALAREFLALGHEVVVLAPAPRKRLPRDDGNLPYQVVRHPRFISTRRLVAQYGYWLRKLHRRCRFDILHCHSVYPTGYLGALNRAKLGVPLVITSHGGDVREDNPRFRKPGLFQRHALATQAADVLVAISEFTSDGFLRLDAQADRIVNLPNGVHLELFERRQARPVDLDSRVPAADFLLFLGRLHRRKGVDVLLEALALMRRHLRPQLVIAGPGPERSALESQARKLRISEQVHFVGGVGKRTKAHLLQNARAVAMPTREWESFGLVVLEAWAAACPVVGTIVPGLKYLIEPGRTGYLVPRESPQQLAEAIEQVYGDPGRARELGQRGQREARRYGWRRIAERHLEVYEDCLRASPSKAA